MEHYRVPEDEATSVFCFAHLILHCLERINRNKFMCNLKSRFPERDEKLEVDIYLPHNCPLCLQFINIWSVLVFLDKNI